MKFIIFSLFFTLSLFPQKKQINYTYKKREKFDLGELSLKGNILSPGDLTARKKKREKIQFELPKRLSFDKEINADIDQSF